ncbi:MAG: hypothetical protein LBU67_08595 [Oscillospiraceae bacterium]|jgi:pilin isopeptide linkage protein|nr:hypothetical protein [Oscillospiraceae bacterium]
MTYLVNDQASLNTALASADSNIDIVVTGSFTVSAVVTIPPGKIVTIASGVGGPYTITRGVGVTGDLFTVQSGATVALTNIVLDGDKGSIADAAGSLVRSNGGGLTIGSGAILQNNRTTLPGGAVYNNGGTVTVGDGGAILGNVSTDEGGGIYLFPGGGSVTISGGSLIANNMAGIDGGGIYASYTDLARITVGSGAIFSDNRASAAYNRNPADDALYASHILGTQWTTPLPQGYNNYDIAYTNGTFFAFPVNASFSAAKLATGAPLVAGVFQFQALDQGGNVAATTTNDALGRVVFPVLSFTTPGTFIYTIRESSPSGDGWTTDSRTYPVSVTVTDDTLGQLTAVIAYPAGLPAFINAYAAPTEATITATKRVFGGACLLPRLFAFGVYDATGNEVTRASNDGGGQVTFPPLTFAQPGVYTYTIRELGQPPCCGWEMDTSIYPVSIAVTDNGSGQLTAQVSYPGGYPAFINRYCPPRGSR